jgi:cell division septation protein DedD
VKDYAKRSTKPVRHKSADGTWFNNLMLMLAILFAGFACVHLMQEYLLPKFKSVLAAHQKNAPGNTLSSSPVNASAEKITPNHVNTNTKKVTNSDSTKKTSTQPPATDNQPKFDFYKLLPQMTVNVPVDDDTTNPALLNTKSIPKTTLSTYVLQIASLQNKADAAQIQNTLKSRGYSAFLQPYQSSDHTNWYRILIGPFHDLKTAQATQDKLDAQQTEALLTTVKN